MNELSFIAKCMYGLVMGNQDYVNIVGHRFYEQVTPKGATFPAGMFVRQSGSDINGAFGQRIAVRGLYQIKAVCEGDSYAPLEGICDVLDEIFSGLNQYQYSAPDFRGNQKTLIIMGVRRMDPVQYSETDDTVRRNHMGGYYQILARDATADF